MRYIVSTILKATFSLLQLSQIFELDVRRAPCAFLMDFKCMHDSLPAGPSISSATADALNPYGGRLCPDEIPFESVLY